MEYGVVEVSVFADCEALEFHFLKIQIIFEFSNLIQVRFSVRVNGSGRWAANVGGGRAVAPPRVSTRES